MSPPPDVRVDPDEDAQFMRLMTAAARAVKAALDRSFKQYDVHAGQQLILGALWEEDGLTPGMLAERIGVAVPTITVGVRRMEANGFLVRRPHERDARLIRVTLTERGRELQTLLPASVSEVTADALAGLTAAERRQLLRVLEQIAVNLPRA